MSCGRCGLLVCNCASFNNPGCGSPGASTGCSPVPPVKYVKDKVCSVCPEDHVEKIVIQEFSTAVCPSNAWNIPVEGETAVLMIPGLVTAVVGEWIHNPNYGFYQITGFNAATNQLVVRNTGLSENAEAGTTVPACTCFVISTNPCDCGSGTSSIFPYVAVDFTAPNNGDCTNVTVTTVNGLQVGKNVGIWTGTYRLQGVVNPTTITICNDGAGLAPGTIVVAKDGAGNFQYPVVTIDTNACTSTAVLTGTVLVCSSNSQVPLESALLGNNLNLVVPALTGTNFEEVHFVPIDAIERTCTHITVALSLVNGTASYTIDVASTTGLTTGDILNIEGAPSGMAFTITAVGSNSFTITASPTPSGTTNIPINAWVCAQTCCEAAVAQINALPFYSDVHSQTDTGPHSIDTVGGATSYEGTHVTWSITNTHPTKTLEISTIFNLTGVISTAGNLAASTYLKVRHGIYFKINGGSTQQPTIARTSTFLDPADDGIQNDANFTWLNMFGILPGLTATFEMWSHFDVLDQPAGGGGIADLSDILLVAEQIGVPG